MFPLNAVLFPGVSVPLTIFEDRYRALVHHLLRVEDPVERVFGSVGIREGYEVGDHGAQSLYRVGCRVQLTEVQPHPDGTFDIVAVGLERIELERLDTSGTFPVGHVVDPPETATEVPEDVLDAVGGRPVADARTAGAARGRGRRRAPDHGHRPAAHRAARHERHPLAARDRGRTHPLVSELTDGSTARRWRGRPPAVRRPRSRWRAPGSTSPCTSTPT